MLTIIFRLYAPLLKPPIVALVIVTFLGSGTIISGPA